MVDSLGYRMKFGVIAPSTNTSVQPEFDAMRPVGVTNHFSRIIIPDNPVTSDDDFNKLMDDIRAALMDSVDAVMTCRPDYLVMGMSAETFWDGLEGSIELERRVEERAGVKVAMGSDACRAALNCYDNVKRLGVITPTMPRGRCQVRKFFTDCGFGGGLNLKDSNCESPMQMPMSRKTELRAASTRVDGRCRGQSCRSHQSRHGAGGPEDRRILARQAGDRDIHGDLWWALRPERQYTDTSQGYGYAAGEALTAVGHVARFSRQVTRRKLP